MIPPDRPSLEQVRPHWAALPRSFSIALVVFSFATTSPYLLINFEFGAVTYWLLIAAALFVLAVPHATMLLTATRLRFSGLESMPADAPQSDRLHTRMAAAYVQFELLSPPRGVALVGWFDLSWSVTDPEALVSAEIYSPTGRRALEGPGPVALVAGEHLLRIAVEEQGSRPHPYLFRLSVLHHRWLIRFAEQRAVASAPGDILILPLEIREPGPFGPPVTSIAGLLQVLDSAGRIIEQFNLSDVTNSEESAYVLVRLPAPYQQGDYTARLVIRTSAVHGNIDLPLRVLESMRRLDDEF